MRNAKRKLFSEEDGHYYNDSVNHWSDLDSDSDFEDPPPWVKKYGHLKERTSFVRPVMSTPKKNAAEFNFANDSPGRNLTSESEHTSDATFESSFWSPKLLPKEVDEDSDMEIVFEKLHNNIGIIKDVNSESVEECNSSASTVILSPSKVTNECSPHCPNQIIVDNSDYSIISDISDSLNVLSDSYLSNIINNMCFCDFCVGQVCDEINTLCN
ncbi:uncharacterized protein LOC124156214 [Ischnura elegans]|uniref:uncharacterized protein LOC124156214 n=1 Tax=Ischnura elegans TaxID=197161 RepID=UPI001ED87B96|nr:uncharacterized protein LOC124156214 [Ischnura elegans]